MRRMGILLKVDVDICRSYITYSCILISVDLCKTKTSLFIYNVYLYRSYDIISRRHRAEYTLFTHILI